MEAERRSKQPWRIDKNIPITMIVVLILQTGTFVAWAAKLDSSVADHERRILVGESYDRDYSRSTLEICQRLARMEERFVGMTSILDQINGKLNMSIPVKR